MEEQTISRESDQRGHNRLLIRRISSVIYRDNEFGN